MTRGNPREFLILHTRRDLDVNYQAETWKKRQRLHLTAKVGSCQWPTSNPDLKAPAMCSRLCHILGRQVFLFRNTTICLATETITEKDKGVRGQGRGAPRIPGLTNVMAISPGMMGAMLGAAHYPSDSHA